MSEFDQYLVVCDAAARAGANELRAWQGRFTAREKSPRDLVTEADLASQRAIEAVVRASFADHEFLGEEGGPSRRELGSQYRWIVDPLDGTANYVHGMRPFCVSVALARGPDVLAGVVYDPTHDECFSATLGGGAWLNGQSIHVSHCARLDAAMIASSLSANVQRDSEEIRQFVEVSAVSQSLRRIGSAALNLCYLASGHLDAYWSTSAKSWDVAAGILLVREAGGVVTAADGGELQLDRPRLAAAATVALHEQLVSVLRRVV